MGGEELSDVSDHEDNCQGNQIFVEISLLHDCDTFVTGGGGVMDKCSSELVRCQYSPGVRQELGR